MNATLEQLAIDLAESRISSRALVERCLAAIQHPEGEGARTFLKINAAESLAAADFYDGQRHRSTPSRFACIPISIKDLFDVAGETTAA
ncbi:MAG: amidase, partial [Gammaproteobacteria bacterium]|nr:amidase [Gammaproteobacteria bacterium]